MKEICIKNDFVEISKNLVGEREKEIKRKRYKNNFVRSLKYYVRNSSTISNVAKFFLHNYFDSPTKLFSDLCLAINF